MKLIDYSQQAISHRPSPARLPLEALTATLFFLIPALLLFILAA